MDVALSLDIAPKTVFAQLGERATRPRFMVRDGEGWLAVTWQSFADDIRDCGLFLRDIGLGDTDRIAIFSNNRISWLSAALGAQSVGGVMVPIYPTSTPEQSAYVFEHSDAKVLFVDGEQLIEKVLLGWESGFSAAARIVLMDPDLDPALVLERLAIEDRSELLWEEIEEKFVKWQTALERGRLVHRDSPDRFSRLLESVSLDQPALMLYTSGTTGRPKGVPLTHRNIAVNGRDWLECNASVIDDDSVDILWLPMSHIFGFGQACLGNTLGFTSYLSDPLSVLGDMSDVKPNIFMSVPRYYEKIVASAGSHPTFESRERALNDLTGGRLSFCLSGGAGLKVEVKEFLHDHGIVVIEGYGLTEASPTLTMNRPDDFRFDSVGKPVPSVEIKLADDGEIWARGESIFGGYHKDDDASRAVLTEDGWLKTGDLGRFTEDGFLQIIGRKKEILVTAGGKNISPVNIEQQFLDDPLFAHVVVYGDGEKYLVGGVWLDPSVQNSDGIEQQIAQKIEAVNDSLARYETIKQFRIMDQPLTVEGGFLTPTLKVKRNKVYEHFEEEFREMYR